ncbi:MAG TPA: lipase maturation factor family protein, partial [Polyangiales bacterium]|nr:lipase maturation factor family protein [Polyangiales bacterium]
MQAWRTGWLGGSPASYRLTRFVFLRGLGLIYAVAFAILWQQGPGLIGSHGLLPAQRLVARVHHAGSFLDQPSLFYWNASDPALHGLALLGLTLSLLVMAGLENAIAMLALWVLYLSYCHIGQIFWGYGWEILLLETGFLAVFLCPLRGLHPFANRFPPSPAVLWMLRWLLFRVMFGAGLIKLRGDPCWRDLTCLVHHYETQPVPSPASWWLHQAPLWFHRLGVAFNHFVELIAPFGLFAPRRIRHVAAAAMIAFQLILIASGNLSFLNWLTLVVCVSCLDDALLSRVLPLRVRSAVERLAALAPKSQSRAQVISVAILASVVGVLSIGPVLNMLSPRQAMNQSFDPLHLVNTYGAFGSVGRVRNEIVLQGTREPAVETAVDWREYELPCKPGDVRRRPCLITPYHYRLDWQMWFAAMSEPESEPWFVHLVYKLLTGERDV